MKNKLTKAQIKRRMKAKVAWIKRIGLKNRNFTIISNNCWGGAVYDEFALPYKTPTIGLWFPSDDYIKFISNLRFYLNAELVQISYEQCHARDLLIKRKERGRYDFELSKMIIGRLEDVDIVFLHYKSFDEALQKWNRRKNRVNYDNLIVKYNDQNGFHKENFYLFKKTNFDNKLFFTCDKSLRGKGVVWLDNKDEEGGVSEDTVLKKLPINVKKYLNKVK